jgi:AraC-like DNA-binding protein
MDALTDALRSLHLRDFKPAVYVRRPPWGVYNIPNAWDVVFYAVRGAPCWLTVENIKDPIQLSDRSIVVLPHGHKYTLQDLDFTTPVCTQEDVKQRPDGYYGVMYYGSGDGPTTSFLFGGFKLEKFKDNPLWSDLPSVIHLPQSDMIGWLDQIYAWMIDELSSRSLGYHSAVSRLGELVIIQAIRTYVVREQSKSGGWIGALHDSRLIKVLNLIHSRLEEPWTLDSLAAEVGMSRSRLVGHFVNHVGEAPMHYVARWRIYRAARLLRETELNISNVVRAVGYESEPSFSNAFKKIHGVPPGRYRRTMRDER